MVSLLRVVARRNANRVLRLYQMQFEALCHAPHQPPPPPSHLDAVNSKCIICISCSVHSGREKFLARTLAVFLLLFEYAMGMAF